MNYDLIIIGGGPAGYRAAERAGSQGLKTLLVEKRNIGGVCLNEGCIPSKVMLYSAKVLDYARNAEKYGVTVGSAAIDHSGVLKKKDQVIKTLVNGVRAGLKKSGAAIAEGTGYIKGRCSEGYEVSVDGETHIAPRLLVAAGSVPVIPSIPGLAEGMAGGSVLTSREIFGLESIPSTLVIIGGGVIGLEMASYFNSAGSKVTVVEMLDHIGGSMDREIGTSLLENLEKKGIQFRLSTRLDRLEKGWALCEGADGSFKIEAEKVLLSIGRRPATEGLGLENIGVELERGAVKTDEYGRTNIPGVFAAGDVNGRSMLAHTAYREAEVCINNMLGQRDTMRYSAIPSVVYTNPEAAGVGETEESARQKGIGFDTVTTSMMYSGRYVAENEKGDGICRLLVDKAFHRLIGVHMTGSYASEIIYGAALMIEQELRVKDIRELVFPHPSVCEVIKEGIFEFKL